MKLWNDGKAGSAGTSVRATVKGMVGGINRQLLSRGVRVVNAMRNAELEVLKGQRSGRIYRKPHTKKATYTASAPGEPPAKRFGDLRMHWNGEVEKGQSRKGMVEIVAKLESAEKYSGWLNNGTKKMKARPFTDRILEKAKPDIKRIFTNSFK